MLVSYRHFQLSSFCFLQLSLLYCTSIFFFSFFSIYIWLICIFDVKEGYTVFFFFSFFFFLNL